MGHQFRAMCQVENRRVLWLMGIMFVAFVTFQYFELPYRNGFSSLFSAGKVSLAEEKSFYTGNPSSTSGMVGNISHVDAFSSTLTYADNAMANNSGTFKGNVTDLRNDFVLEGNQGLNNGNSEQSSSVNLNEQYRSSTVDDGFAPEETRETESSYFAKNDSMDGYSLMSNIGKENSNLTSENSNAGFASPLPASTPKDSSPTVTLPTNVHSNVRSPDILVKSNISSEKGAVTPTSNQDGTAGQLHNNLATLGDNSSVISAPEVKERPEIQTAAVISIAEMNNLLLDYRATQHSMKPRFSSSVDQELLHAKSQIENAPIVKNDPQLYAPLYRNISEFKRSYELMEGTLKVYIYREGQKPIFHQPLLKGIYASEGWFMKLLKANKKFVTKNSRKAHLFYLPFSTKMLEETLYVPGSHNRENLIEYLKSYLDMIAMKYPFWNSTQGADHFLVACHDWAPSETRQHMNKCIRALCNSDVKEGFAFGKDVSLPETYVRTPQKPLRDLGGKPPSKRTILAFFAGNMHGYLRPILLQHWGDKDPDMKIFGEMPKVKGNMNYIEHMKSSKYCICARGYEVNSPRVVEAIFYECVPVIISDNFVPAFFEVLNWESFAVFVLEKDIPNLKNILLSIPEKRFRRMQMRLKKVQQHFLWHPRPVKYDIFHMILHSIWYNRVLQIWSR
ncbi:Exostosin domain-containing protein [Cephalotus follicularis]|uniref:Exostosin domain-containing protein n=1 Tax=Cephalotus follicularis TaxID=3775 RepID=A0A1Q3CWK0_CEPFO|nr:Exostosin domain-containing protein [Cephalotus follicularis]